jgi:hypothetical protein
VFPGTTYFFGVYIVDKYVMFSLGWGLGGMFDQQSNISTKGNGERHFTITVTRDNKSWQKAAYF